MTRTKQRMASLELGRGLGVTRAAEQPLDAHPPNLFPMSRYLVLIRRTVPVFDRMTRLSVSAKSPEKRTPSRSEPSVTPAHEGVEVADVIANRLVVDEMVARAFAASAPGLQRSRRAADIGGGRLGVVPRAAGVGVENAPKRALDKIDRDVRHGTHLQ